MIGPINNNIRPLAGTKQKRVDKATLSTFSFLWFWLLQSDKTEKELLNSFLYIVKD